MSDPTVKAIFEEYFTTLNDAVFRFCLFRVSNREQALDLTQETFLRLWQTLETGKAIDNVRSFLFTVARHLVIDYYRKKKTVSLDWLAEEDPAELIDRTTGSEQLELGAEGRYLLEQINKLPPSYRQAVYLRYVEDLSPPEIATILKISTNAASVRINRGLEELRRQTGYDSPSEGHVVIKPPLL